MKTCDLLKNIMLCLICLYPFAIQAIPIANPPSPQSYQTEQSDGQTTGVVALHLPQYQDLAELMQGIEMAHERAKSSNRLVAIRSTEELQKLTRGLAHSSHQPSNPEERQQFIDFTNQLYRATRQHSESLKSGDARKIKRSALELAISCQACHQVYKPE